LTTALDATAQRRNSTKILEQYSDIVQTVRNSEVMQNQWRNYQKDFEYAYSISFDDTCDAILKLMSRLKAHVNI
jgi:hypothetical protein